MQSFEPDGASEEGLMYWSYGLTNAFLALEAMQRNLTTTYGLTDLNGISKTGIYTTVKQINSYPIFGLLSFLTIPIWLRNITTNV